MDKVLFLCPHSAAKSVLAAAYFNHLAQQRGLSLVADFAGTEPDEVVSPKVLALLKENDLPLPTHGPRLVTQEDLDASARIISIGCSLDGVAASNVELEDWSDVPPVSVDAPAAAKRIHERVESLLALMEQTPR